MGAFLLSTILPLVVYGGLAAAAAGTTWHDSCLRWVGFWLLVTFLTSNALWYFGVVPQDRTGVYTCLQVMLSVATVCAWDVYQRRILVPLVGLAALSVCSNIAFAAIVSPVWRQIHTWEVTTNLCFAAECLLAIWGGVSHGRKLGHFLRWPLSYRAPASVHAHTESDAE